MRFRGCTRRTIRLVRAGATTGRLCDSCTRQVRTNKDSFFDLGEMDGEVPLAVFDHIPLSDPRYVLSSRVVHVTKGGRTIRWDEAALACALSGGHAATTCGLLCTTANHAHSLFSARRGFLACDRRRSNVLGRILLAGILCKTPDSCTMIARGIG